MCPVRLCNLVKPGRRIFVNNTPVTDFKADVYKRLVELDRLVKVSSLDMQKHDCLIDLALYLFLYVRP